jgi:hypothetical protein
MRVVLALDALMASDGSPHLEAHRSAMAGILGRDQPIRWEKFE